MLDILNVFAWVILVGIPIAGFAAVITVWQIKTGDE